MRFVRFPIFAVLFLLGQPVISWAATCQPTSYSVHDISKAIKEATGSPPSVIGRSCMWGGAAEAESGGNVCARNPNNFGVLQLSAQNIANLGLTPAQYMSESLQQQVDGWALAGASQNNTSTGFKLIDKDIAATLKTGNVMDGLLAACSQFGAVVCNNDVTLIERGLALPITKTDGAIPCKNSSCNNGTANQDGNGHTIISWGLAIQNKIYQSRCVD